MGDLIRITESKMHWSGLPSDIGDFLIESTSLKPITGVLMMDTYEIEIRIKAAKER